MRTILVLSVITISAALAGDWATVGGNNEHNGLAPHATGPRWHEVRWEAQTLPATIAMQVLTWDTFAVTMRYNFSPMQGPLVCHSIITGDRFGPGCIDRAGSSFRSRWATAASTSGTSRNPATTPFSA